MKKCNTPKISATNGARAGRESGNAWQSLANETRIERAKFARGSMQKINLKKSGESTPRDFSRGGSMPYLRGMDDIAGKVAHRAVIRAEANRVTLSFAEAKEEARGVCAEIIGALCAPDDNFTGCGPRSEAQTAARATLAHFKLPEECAPHRAVFLGAARGVDRMQRKMSHFETLPEDYVQTGSERILAELPEDDNRREFALQDEIEKARALVRRAFIYHRGMVSTIKTTRKGRQIGGAIRRERAALRRDLRFIRRAFAYRRAVLTGDSPSGRIAFTLRIAGGVSPAGSGAKIPSDWSLKKGKARARAAWSNMLRDYRRTAARLNLPKLMAADLLHA